MTQPTKAAVCVIGPQPPPRHGVSAVNARIVEVLRASDIEVVVVDTRYKASGMWRTLGRVVSAMRAVVEVNRFCWGYKTGAAYLSFNGGWGILADILVLLVIRVWKRRIYGHHHSFRYIAEDFWPMKAVAILLSEQGKHIVLCRCMGDDLENRYPRIRRALVISNAGMIDVGSMKVCSKRKCRVIGHLSNLSPEKGLWDVLDLAERAQRLNVDCEFRVAGPFENAQVEHQFRRRLTGLSNILYLGPLFGEKKAEFFRGLSVFVFPTRYINEAEPLVICEALSAGIPAIAYERGCISSMIDKSAGVILPRDREFAREALEVILHWQADGEEFNRICDGAHRKFASMRSESLHAVEELISELKGVPNDAS